MVVKCQEVPVFHPTLRDINGSWEAYIESIERRFAHVGLAKIVPPKGWTPRKAGYSDDFDFPIPRPIRQAHLESLYCRSMDALLTLERSGLEPIKSKATVGLIKRYALGALHASACCHKQ